MIYDELFTPLTQRPKHFDTYVLPSEWPEIDFTPYRSLLLTCKEVKEEARTHFEGHFAQDVMVFFDNIVDFRNFYSKLERASHSEKLAEMWVCIHTLPSGIQHHLFTEPTTLLRFNYFNSHTNRCCVKAIIDNDLNPQISHGIPLKEICRVIAGSSRNPPFNCAHKMRGHAKLDVLEMEGRSGPSRPTFKTISRQICAKFFSMYTQMVAPISRLGGHEAWGLPTDYKGSILDEKRESAGDGLLPGTREYEQELKEKYELDA